MLTSSVMVLKEWERAECLNRTGIDMALTSTAMDVHEEGD